MAKKKVTKKKNKNRVEKPWGYYEDFYRGDQVVFKRIVVNPDESLSYQIHKKRDEFWFVAEGSAAIVIKDKVLDVIDATTVNYGLRGLYIQKLWPHAVKNVGSDLLVIYEMQFGQPTEEDIFRLEDKYGRKDSVDKEDIEEVSITDNTKDGNDAKS